MIQLLQLSSKVASFGIAASPSVGGPERDAGGGQAGVLGCEVVNREGGERYAVLLQGALIVPRPGEARRLERDPGAVGCLGRGERDPARAAGGDVFLLHEAEHVAVERERAIPILDNDRQQRDLDFSSSSAPRSAELDGLPWITTRSRSASRRAGAWAC